MLTTQPKLTEENELLKRPYLILPNFSDHRVDGFLLMETRVFEPPLIKKEAEQTTICAYVA
jgi:hypothetical protein